MSKRDNSMFYATIFFTFVPLFIWNGFYGANVVTDLETQTAFGVQDVRTFQVDNNWSSTGMIDGLSTDGDVIYAPQNQQGTWTSYMQYIPRNRVVELNYMAQVLEGEGNITVRAWEYDPEMDLSNPNETRTFDLMTGDRNETINFSEYNYFDVKISLVETEGNSDKIPNVDSLTVDFEIVEGQQRGVENSTLLVVFFLLMLLGVSQIIIGLYLVLRED